jgi:hypothetical protein
MITKMVFCIYGQLRCLPNDKKIVILLLKSFCNALDNWRPEEFSRGSTCTGRHWKTGPAGNY